MIVIMGDPVVIMDAICKQREQFMPVLLDLFMTFAKIGLFTFGGGYAMISLIEDACVVKKKWITHDDMMNVTVIAESTPGPIAINCATFVGFKQQGLPGAAAATTGIVLPSFLIILVISGFLDNYLDIPWIAHAFKGIRIAVSILIFNAGLNMLRKMPKKQFSCMIAVSSFILMLLACAFEVRISSIAFMLAAGSTSLVLFLKQRTTEAGERK